MPTNFPNGLTSQGVPLLPNVPLTTGRYFFVSSTQGADSNSGLDKQHPLATIQAAINKCTANKGDIVLVMPGHAETISSATILNFSVAGVRVVGLGIGLLRPTLTYTTATTATVTVSAANCGIDNVHHIANFANIATAYTVGAAKDFQITNCSFVDNSAVLNFLIIVTALAGTNNSADGLTFNNNYVYNLPTTDGAVVAIGSNLLRLSVCDNVVSKPAATNDAGHLITMGANNIGGCRILRNSLTMIALASQATGVLFTGSSTSSSGMCADNRIAVTDATSVIIATTGTKISFVENYLTGQADKSGLVWPAADNPA